MERIIIEYDKRNSMAKKLIEFILSVDFFKVEKYKSPYKNEYVEKIRKIEKENDWTAVKTEDLWK
jgi:hypothetical protein